MLLNCGVGEDSCKSLGLQGGPIQSILREINPGISLGSILIFTLSILGIHTEETRIESDTCTPMFIATLYNSQDMEAT